MSISDYLPSDDPTLPLIPKDKLQKYDNYQIYNLYCVDTQITAYLNGVQGRNTTIKNLHPLAVQVYSPHIIHCDFNQIATTYK